MLFPSKDIFLEKLGLEPEEEDPSMAFCRYVYCGSNSENLDISFSDVTESFQLISRFKGEEVINIYSENVENIRFREDKSGLSLNVSFKITGMDSNVIVSFEPKLKVHWSTLRSTP